MSDTTVQNPVFPYLIAEPGRECSAYIKVSIPRHSEAADQDVLDGETTLFYLPGASIVSRDSMDGLRRHTITLRHSFARDDELDGVYVARLELKALQQIASWEGNMRYAALLSEVLFYPVAKDNPFIGATAKDETTDYYANGGYPYLPPSVTFQDAGGNPALKFPLEVEVTLTYNITGEKLSKQFTKTMRQHAASRQERHAKHAAYLAAESAKRAARDAERQAWLQTEEGKDDTALRQILNRLRQVPTGPEEREWVLTEMREQGEQYAHSLSAEQVTRVNRARSNSLDSRLARPENHCRVAFAAGFDAVTAAR